MSTWFMLGASLFISFCRILNDKRPKNLSSAIMEDDV